MLWKAIATLSLVAANGLFVAGEFALGTQTFSRKISSVSPWSIRSRPDTCLGMVHVKDIFHAMTRGTEALTVLSGVTRSALFLPEAVKLDALLLEFQRNRVPVAMLVDEYGVVSGMITLDNVLEEKSPSEG